MKKAPKAKQPNEIKVQMAGKEQLPNIEAVGRTTGAQLESKPSSTRPDRTFLASNPNGLTTGTKVKQLD
jgi:hypothetical protein